MSLYYYIPNKRISLILNGHTMVAVSIHDMNINIDKLQGSYKIWLDTGPNSRPLLQAGGINDDVINMGELDINSDAYFFIDDDSFAHINCRIGKSIYNHLKHAYLVDISFVLNKKVVESFIHKKKKKN